MFIWLSCSRIFSALAPLLIDLVEGEDHGYTRRLRVVDGFACLWHHTVVRRDHDDRDVGDLRTAGTHGGERFVTRCIEEGDALAALQLHAVCTDVLGDTTGLTGDHVRFADVIEQGGLAVVDVAHDGDDRRTGRSMRSSTSASSCKVLLHIGTDELHFEAVLLGDHGEGFGIEALVDAHHHTQREAGLDDVGHRHAHHARQLAGGHEFGDLERHAGQFLGGLFFFVSAGRVDRASRDASWRPCSFRLSGGRGSRSPCASPRSRPVHLGGPVGAGARCSC
jgi:hypothetical protein